MPDIKPVVAHEAPPRHTRAGLSLLEVLISCGILVIGLSSVAAILPASSSRLAEAALEDRCGVLAANAFADVVNRGLVTSAIFADPAKPVVFGRVLPTSGISGVAAANATKLALHVDTARAFWLEDEVLFSPAVSGSVPSNTFRSVAGTVLFRDFREAVCYGVMISPSTPPAAPGGSALLSVAIFRKLGQARQFALTSQGGAYKLAAADTDFLKMYFKPCTYVLAMPTGGQPRWLRVASSWKTGAGGTTTPETFVTFTDTGAAGGSPTVIGFDGLVRVAEYPVTLN
ncbi:MAG: hypothetical protein DWI04_05185 [Planctomycetota bacterium]|nr:MAG: hypothetical protein DWI04_05185 [Planctomycetota bacterium]